MGWCSATVIFDNVCSALLDDKKPTWVKAQCGYAFSEAVEIYPSADRVVNVANMRHLWVLEQRMPFSW